MHTNNEERTADMVNPAAKYTDEFRRDTADCIISTGRPATECYRELGLNPKTVDKWVARRRCKISGEPNPRPASTNCARRRSAYASLRWRTRS